jgi:hypothetical protein
VRWGVCRERQHKRQDHELVSVKQAVGKDLASGCNDKHDECGESGAEQNDLAHDRACAMTDCTAVRQRPTEFLFERQKKAWSESEGGEPQRCNRLKLFIAANCSDPNFEEGVRCKSCNEESDANGNRALG